MTPGPASPDAIVVGSGIIGLSAAAALADTGMRVVVFGEPLPGEASLAAAGLLAPSVEDVTPAHVFAVASRDRYPSYLAWLLDRTGVRVPLNRSGILEVALDDQESSALATAPRQGARWLPSEELAKLEPSLAHAVGGFLHPDDGAVDNVELFRALRELVKREPRIEWIRESVTRVESSSRSVLTARGERYSANTIVIAAGAWAPRIEGLASPLPIEPVRGQIAAFRSTVLRHPVFGAGIYLVPRETGVTLAGSTMERVGFQPHTTHEGISGLHAAAVKLCPSMAASGVMDSWAGLRPVTPDLLPIIDRDPACPALLYACGHSRNGILMAPLTADCVALLVGGKAPPYDLSPFALSRFTGRVAG